jgi:hypothetical protein
MLKKYFFILLVATQATGSSAVQSETVTSDIQSSSFIEKKVEDFFQSLDRSCGAIGLGDLNRFEKLVIFTASIITVVRALSDSYHFVKPHLLPHIKSGLMKLNGSR